MREALVSAFVLHRRPYRESSLLVEVLAEGHGRIGLVARGAARGARRGCSLEPFVGLGLGWRGRGELMTLSQCESGRPYRLGRDRLAFGLYLNELVLRLVPRHTELPELYGLYAAALERLGDEQPWMSVLRFELGLLEALGHPIVSEGGAGGEDIVAQRRYRYAPGEGIGVSAGAGVAVTGRALLALESGRFEEAAQGELLAFTGALISHLLGGRQLASRALLRLPDLGRT